MKDLTHLEITDYLKILWNRRWYFLTVFILVASGASIYAYRMPDMFKSVTRIAIEDPMVSKDYVRPTVWLSVDQRLESIYRQLASRTFLARMVEQFRMFGYGESPDFLMEDAVQSAAGRIGIEKTSEDTFEISFVAADPQFAQTVTRQLAQELMRISTSSSKNIVIATDQFIDEQLKKTSEALAAQGEKITKFKILHLGELPSQSDANVTALNGLHSRLAAAEAAIQQAQERMKLLDFKRQERKRLNLISDELAAAKIRGTNESTPSPLETELTEKKARLAQYMAKYTPNYPDVVALERDIKRIEQQIRDERTVAGSALAPIGGSAAAEQNNGSMDQTDPREAEFQFEADNIKAEIARRENEKQEIEKQIKLYQSRLNLAPTLEQELETLLREEEVLRVQYANLQNKKFSSEMAVETDSTNVTYRVIDEANLPVTPEYPDRAKIVLIGIGAGLALGIGAGFSRELLDSTIGSEEEAKRLLDLPILVTIPTVPKEKKRQKIA